MSPRVFLLAWAERRNASARIRIFDLADWLESRGIEATASAPVGGRFGDLLARPGFGGVARRALYIALQLCLLPRRVSRARRADLVVMQREAFPFGGPFIENWILASGVPVLFDIDDALHIRPTHFRPFGHRLRRFDKAEKIARGARAVIVSSEELERWAAPIAQRVVRIPTPVDTEWFRPSTERPRNDPPVLGWTGTAGNLAHLESIRGALARLRLRRSFRIVVIGERAPSRWGSPEVEFLPWSAEMERRLIPGFDAGLMPLVDSPYARAKAGYKALVYMACGVPAVISPIGTNREILDDGVEGLFASSEAEWIEALDRLLGDPDLRVSMGARARERVVRERSMDAIFPRWSDLIRELAG